MTAGSERGKCWLASAGQKVWQLLPATPIGPANSPYQGVSAFAGSQWMVALEPLVHPREDDPAGRAALADLAGEPGVDPGHRHLVVPAVVPALGLPVREGRIDPDVLVLGELADECVNGGSIIAMTLRPISFSGS